MIYGCVFCALLAWKMCVCVCLVFHLLLLAGIIVDIYDLAKIMTYYEMENPLVEVCDGS